MGKMKDIITATQGMTIAEEIEYLNKLVDAGKLTVRDQYDLGILSQEQYERKYREEWGSEDPEELRFEDVL